MSHIGRSEFPTRRLADIPSRQISSLGIRSRKAFWGKDIFRSPVPFAQDKIVLEFVSSNARK